MVSFNLISCVLVERLLTSLPLIDFCLESSSSSTANNRSSPSIQHQNGDDSDYKQSKRQRLPTTAQQYNGNDLYNIWTSSANPSAYGLVSENSDPNGTQTHPHQQHAQHQQHYETTTLYTPPTSATSLGTWLLYFTLLMFHLHTSPHIISSFSTFSSSSSSSSLFFFSPLFSLLP